MEVMTLGLARLESAVLVVFVSSIVLFALGSSSAAGLTSFGQSARWVALLMLCGLGVACAARTPRAPRPLRFIQLCVLGAIFAALALLSTAWSVAPKLTFERGVTLALLFVAAASLAYAFSARPDMWPWVVVALLAGAVIVCVMGLALLAVATDDAVQSAFAGSPARYRGLGENPNTVPMLAAVATPIAYWVGLEWESQTARLLGWLSMALLVGTIAASNSRGALVAAVAGTLTYGLTRPFGTRVATVLLVVVMVVGAYGTLKVLPTSNWARGGSTTSPTGGAHKPGRKGGGSTATPVVNPAGFRFWPAAFENEIGRPVTTGGTPVRTTFGSSGRLTAWEGALKQGDQQPLLGYGFGTEERVFVDRYYYFQGSRPENSYLGLYLQLGAVGVAVLLAIWLVLGRALWSTFRMVEAPRSSNAAVAGGVVLAGVMLTIVQSYIYAVGNIATLSFWVAAFMLAAVARRG